MKSFRYNKIYSKAKDKVDSNEKEVVGLGKKQKRV